MFSDVVVPKRPYTYPKLCNFSKLHLKDKKRFEKANQDSNPGLSLEEFIAFEHPEEVDYMMVRRNSFSKSLK